MFKRIFPVPETWDKLPPESRRQRIIGNLYMTGVIAAANVLATGAMWIVTANTKGALDELESVAEAPVNKECTLNVATSPAGFILRIAADKDSADTSARQSWGPLSVEREQIGNSRLTVGQQNGETQGEGAFEFNASTFPEGAGTYDVAAEHDLEITEGIGPLEFARRETLQEPCGSLALSIQDGVIKRISAS